MERFKLQKGKSFFEYIRDSIDVPMPSDLWPSGLMGRSLVRLVAEPTPELLEQFASLLASDSRSLCDTRYSTLMHSCLMPDCQIILATPNDAPALVIGGIIFVHLSDSELSYVAALYVRKDFRGQRIGRTLYEQFERTFDRPQRIAFCDFLRSNRARLRPSLFPIEGRYSILRMSGFAANITLAANQVITNAYRNMNDDRTLPEICSFCDVSLDQIADYDAGIAGRKRIIALKEMQQMNNFVGMVAYSGGRSNDDDDDDDDMVLGYAISMSGLERREMNIGPIYANNLVIAICLLKSLCCALKDDKIICLHIPHIGHRMLRFLHDRALCEVDKQFDRFYTHSVDVPMEDLSRVFVAAAKVILPDC